jgi:predicted  nucleic acid-binding Zn-ribbon protein
MIAITRYTMGRRRPPEVVTDQKEVIERIVADLRDESDRWNNRMITARENGAEEVSIRYSRKLHEELRRLANKYERWIKESKPAVSE